jgi:hypothetical protein
VCQRFTATKKERFPHAKQQALPVKAQHEKQHNHKLICCNNAPKREIIKQRPKKIADRATGKWTP